MKLLFKGTPDLESYHGKPGKWEDGESKEIPDEIAKELLSSFPKNFSKAKDETKEKSTTSKLDKSAKTEHDK